MAGLIAETGKVGGGAIAGALLALAPMYLNHIENVAALDRATREAAAVREVAQAHRVELAERYRTELEAETARHVATQASQQAAYTALTAICARVTP